MKNPNPVDRPGSSWLVSRSRVAVRVRKLRGRLPYCRSRASFVVSALILPEWHESEEHLPVGLHAVRHDVAERRHGIGGFLEPAGIDVGRRQVSPAVLHEPVPREVDDDAVGRRRHRGQPFLQGFPDVGQRRSCAREQPHVLGRKRPALVADEHAVHRLGVALREQQLPRLVEVAVLAHADDEGIAARHRGELDGPSIRGLEDQVAAPGTVLLRRPRSRLLCRPRSRPAGGARRPGQHGREDGSRGATGSRSSRRRVHAVPPDIRSPPRGAAAQR